ncbi:MAG: GtrA family protein [Firmicutes bacterium]|nr:GtrA family protein [Bacillota bacterium]
MKKIRNILHTEFFRYCVIGAATTLLDLSVYYVLVEIFRYDPNICNVISISASIMFAYVANKLFVFRTHCGSFGALLLEIAKFWSSRIGTMFLEIGGVFVLTMLGWDGFASKLATQIVIFVANYLLSKFFAFRGKE